MIWVDYAILVIVALSAIIGFFRGFVREAIGLATWLLAFYVAYRLTEPVGALLESFISVRSVRLAAAFGGVFLLVLIGGAVFNYFMGRLVSGTGFAGTDRALGGLFGVLRGVAVLVLVVLLAGLTALPNDRWWRESVFMPHLQDGAVWLRDYLPVEVAEEIRFGNEATPLAPDGQDDPAAPTAPQL
ncbi:MAG: colicin V production CvpA [Salinisphaeraceae bacterium]|jgi:membrane protein required for colicin V production|nr:colicin V production CvpA [Salinisphaeraceae bacterium]